MSNAAATDHHDRDDRPFGGSLVVLAAGALAVALSVAGLALSSVTAHYGCYVLASVVGFTCVAVHRRALTSMIAVSDTVIPRAANVVMAVIVGAGFVSSIVHAWFIARHYA